LVTGANGFIGRRMLGALQSRGIRTIGLDRTANPAVVEWITADIVCDAPIVLPNGIDTIIHLAGKAHALSEVAQDESEYFRINTEGTRNILEAAKRANVRAVVLFSTIKAMADPPAGQDGAIDESWPVLSNSAYGQSKRAAEALVLDGGYVPHPVVLRPCLVYGPSPKGNLEKMITAVRRKRFPPFPEVKNKRSMVHVDDLISAALLAPFNPAAAGQTYIVADDESFSTRELFEWICGASGIRVPRWTMPIGILQIMGYVGDTIGKLRGRRFVFDSDALAKLTGSAWYSSAKLQRELGWRPQHTLRESIPEILYSQTGLG
jgi:nucleoside-diphosphate-sugar epimerase